MPLPEPEPGLVISFAYVWRAEHVKGQKEGRKARPCVIILSVEKQDKEKLVTVAPVTHTPPGNAAQAIEIPSKVKAHLKLDSGRSWVIVTEVNQFVWPGYDLHPVPGSKSCFAFGFVPPKLFEKIKTGVLDLFLERRLVVTKRK